MAFDPHTSARLRDRALDRLNGLTTGAAALGLVATAGFGTVAAMTTHVPGASDDQAADPASLPGDNGIRRSSPGGTFAPTTPSTDGGVQPRVAQPQANGGASAPTTRSSTRRHASTGGS
jgi:hypothetical protein